MDILNVFQYTLEFSVFIVYCSIGDVDKLASRLRLEPHFILVLGPLTKSLHDSLDLVQILRRMTEFDIAPDLGRRPFENHLISWRIVIVILENIIFIDKGNLHREVIEDEIGLLD
ncbi:Uncharacterised protein [Streptococcus pneumoniae]|nr:Uncharacterised protein [Streptococcus pneumoniae]